MYSEYVFITWCHLYLKYVFEYCLSKIGIQNTLQVLVCRTNIKTLYVYYKNTPTENH